MNSPRAITSITILAALLLGGLAIAQRNRGGFDRNGFGGGGFGGRNGVPDWEGKDHMPDDVFTFDL